MKKLYVTPEIEVVKFNVLTDVLYVSTTQPETQVATEQFNVPTEPVGPRQ